MLPIYSSNTIRQWDEFTIQTEPITSIDLMERAANNCVDWVIKNISNQHKLAIVCGNGNNGGDGLAMARILVFHNYQVKVYLAETGERSADNRENLEKLQHTGFADFVFLKENSELVFVNNEVIIDCIFGTGLNKNVEGLWKNIISQINKSEKRVLSIDIPSGLFSEPQDGLDISGEIIIKASTTLSLQVPKLSMLLPGWGQYCGDVVIIEIGLSNVFAEQNPCDKFFIELKEISKRFKQREKFSHKGTFGHALIIAGSMGKCGAGILSSGACIKSGSGLVTIQCSYDCNTAIHSTVPEIMISESELNQIELAKYSAIGVGPGMGTEKSKVLLLENILAHGTQPLLLDADAISILAYNTSIIGIPENTILTPHPKEFDRLVGESANAWLRLQKAQKFAVEKKVIVVLKGAYTAVCGPDGNIYINSTGNAGMATAGSGDVLTGIITSLLAQGYLPLYAAIVGVYMHGMAGDLAAKNNSITGMVASDIIENLNGVFKGLEG